MASLLFLLPLPLLLAANPHAPGLLTWEIQNPTGQVVWKVGPVEKGPGGPL